MTLRLRVRSESRAALLAGIRLKDRLLPKAGGAMDLTEEVKEAADRGDLDRGARSAMPLHR